MMAARLVAAALLALLIAPTAALTAGQETEQDRREAREAMRRGDFDAPTIGWREGPVRYLLSKEEDRTYRGLSSRDERVSFIERFWTARDPNVATPENEFRALFLNRTREASQLFTTESTKPGWKTDRGKIYILCGSPDDFDPGSIRQGFPEVIIWTYHDPPAGTANGPDAQFRFVRDASGEYRLTSAARLFLSQTALSSALAMQAMQVGSLPETRVLPPGTVEISPPEAPGAFRLRGDFFRAGRGRTLVVLTLWVKDGPSLTEVTARLVPSDPALSSAHESDTVLRAGTGEFERALDGSRLFQGGLVVRPGEYVAHILLPDPSATPPVDSFSRRIIAPDLDGGTLRVGAITLASRLERLHQVAWPEYAAPFTLGQLHAVPRADSQIRRGEDLGFYFQVLGGSTDPIEGLPDLDLEYRFLSAVPATDGSTNLQPFGHPIHLTHEQSLVQGFALPLTEWAPGGYRLEVTVTDNLTGGTARGEIDFSVR